MPEKNIKRLSEVIDHIKEVIDGDLGGRHFWIKAELSNINFHRNGHCYIDLVENEHGKTLAQCRANIWAMRLREIRQNLGSDFENILKKGAEVLCLGQVVFHPIYGLSINITAFDKTFALGEIERRKQASLKKLEELQLLEKNGQLKLPAVIQRIALVGSPGTSGHTDFLKMLERNEHQFDFRTTDFPCQVQGDHAAGEIIKQLKNLKGSDFDVIVLIRGGGSKLDLEVFNAFELAKTIAMHDKPVLTGIGHETDVSVADVVANRYFKTPSAVGAFVVDRAFQYYVRVKDTYKSIRKFHDHFIRNEHHRLQQALQSFESESISYTRLRRGELHTQANRINALAQNMLSTENEMLNLSKEVLATRPGRIVNDQQRQWKNAWELAALGIQGRLNEEVRALQHSTEVIGTMAGQLIEKEKAHLKRTVHLFTVYHPERTLERGWALVRKNGQVVDNQTELTTGDELEIELHNRTLLTTFEKETKKWKNSITKTLQKN